MLRLSILTFVLFLFSGCGSGGGSGEPENSANIVNKQLDRGNFGKFFPVEEEKIGAYSLTQNPTGVFPSEAIESFSLQADYCSKGNGSCKDTFRARSEISQIDKNTIDGDEYWYGWYIYFPTTYKNIDPVSTTLGQFHQYEENAKDNTPAWMFRNDKDGYYLFNNVKENGVHVSNDRKTLLIDTNELKGKWHKIEVHAKWSKDKMLVFLRFLLMQKKSFTMLDKI